MKISRFAIDRPIFTIMLTLIIILLGAVSLSRLPIDLMPDITYPTLSISTDYKDASPEEIEELITRPIEEAMSAVPGVEEVASVSMEGTSNVRITFVWGTDLDVAANDIRDRLDRIISRLPEEAERPGLRKFDLASFPVLILGASGDLDPIQMRRIIDNQVKYRIERVPGVASLSVWGGLDREIHVNLWLEKIKALNLPIDTIMNRIQAENVNVPAGNIERGNLEILIRTPGEYTSLDELRNTVISIREGAPVKLGDIAAVEDSWEKVTRIVRVNGKPGIRLSVYKQSGKNTVAVAREVLKELETINRDIPQLNLIPIIDTSDYISRSIRNVGFAAIFGGLLAILVLLFFLGSFRSTAIIGTAIPISIIATFALIYFGGFTLNLMTLGGLALGVGMLVDNAIVVLENIYRLRQSGMEPYKAAVSGSEEVTAAIIASTLTTLAVFLPTIFIRGMSGIMFKQMAYVVGFSLLCSLVVALSLVPMLSAKILKVDDEPARPGINIVQQILHASKGLFCKLEKGYQRLLHFAIDHRWLFSGVTLLVLFGCLTLIPLIGVEFMPAADEGEVRISGEMEVGTRLEVGSEKFKAIEEIVKEAVPEALNISTSIGGGWRSTGSHSGQIRITLKPISERTRSSEDIADDLRLLLAHIPGIKIRTRAGQGLFILRMGTSEGDKVEIEISGHDLATARLLSERVKQIVEKVDGITDAQISREEGSPEELIMVDRLKAADMKLSMSQIANALQTVLSGTRAGNFREKGDEFAILVKVKDAEAFDTEDLLDLTLINRDGEPVVLRNVVDIRPQKGPIRIERKNQERIILISANISGRDMGSVLKDIRSSLMLLPVPRDFSITFGGEYEEQQKAFRELLLSLLLSIILVYMVMACQFESLRDPFVVMFSVPLAIIGVILILFFTKTTFNVQAYIGCIMLGGIVVNNAILLVDHTNQLRRLDGMPLRKAIEDACHHRLRPVLMTAMTTILGLIPLAIGIGEGGEAQAPLARTVIGGLLSSTLITLIIIPIVYFIFEHWRPKDKKGQRGVGIACILGIALLFSPVNTNAGMPEEQNMAATLFQQGKDNGLQGKTDKKATDISPPAFKQSIPEQSIPVNATNKGGKSVPLPSTNEEDASGTLTLTVNVKDAILMVLENNHSLNVERMEPAITKSFEEKERAVFDPVIGVDAETSRERTTEDASQKGGDSTDKAGAEVDISGFIPTGTEVEISLSTNKAGDDLYADQYTTRAGLSVTQAILRGSRIKVNLASLRQARLDTFASQYEFRGFAESLIAEMENTYWEYALAQRRIEIFIESLNLAEQQMKETEERIRIGVLAEIERAASEAEVALRKEDLINARSELSKVRLRLLRLLNPSGPDPWDMKVLLLDKPQVPDVVLDDIDAHVTVGLRMRSDLNQARLETEKGDLEIVKTKDGLMPKMDFFIALGKSGYADSFSRSVTDIDGDGYDIRAGISLEYPFFNRDSKARHKRALLSRQKADYALKNLSLTVQMDIRSAYIEVSRSKEQVYATAATRKLQEEKMRAETEKFRVGKSTSLLVAQTQRDLVESRISEIQAIVGHLKSLIELYRLEGSLLERRGITLPGVDLPYPYHTVEHINRDTIQ